MDKSSFVLNTFSLIPDVQLSPIQPQKLFLLIEQPLQQVCKFPQMVVNSILPGHLL